MRWLRGIISTASSTSSLLLALPAHLQPAKIVGPRAEKNGGNVRQSIRRSPRRLMGDKPLPPYGREYLDRPTPCLWVAIGSGSWEFSRRKPWPVLVVPGDHRATDFRWPDISGGALLYECGAPADDRLFEAARELLKAGATFVFATRLALIQDAENYTVVYYPEIERVHS